MAFPKSPTARPFETRFRHPGAGLALAMAFFFWQGGFQAPALEAQEPSSSEDSAGLSLEQIMADPIWIGKLPENPYWSIDSEHIYYARPRLEEDDRDLLRVTLSDLETDGATTDEAQEEGDAEVVEGAAWADVDSRRAVFSEDRQMAVFVRLGDLFVRHLGDGELRQLTRTAEAESAPFFLADGKAVAFQRGGQPYVFHLGTGLVEQMADLRTEEDPDEEEDAEDFLSLQQTRLLQFVRQSQEREAASEAWDRARREADPTAPPRPFYFGKDREIDFMALSPTGQALLVVTSPEKRDRGRHDQMPSYVSEDGYVEIREVRPKVGTGDGSTQDVSLLDLEGHHEHRLDLSTLPGISDDPLAEIRAATLRAKKERAAKKKAEDAEESSAADDGDEESQEGDSEEAEEGPRAVDVGALTWSPDGAHAAIQVHSIDNKDRWIFLVSPPSEGNSNDKDESDAEITVRAVHRLSNPEGWINWSYNDMDWLDASRLWFLSEESGWSQLYLYDVKSGETQRLTQGEMVVSDPQVDPQGKFVYYTANPEHPGRYETYRVAVATSEVEKVSSLGGQASFQLSPDGEKILLEHSHTTRPPELFWQAAQPGAQARRLTHTVSDAFQAFDWVDPEIVPVPSSHHDRPIYTRFYPARNPERLRGADGKIPAVVFVHGAGYLQNSHLGFSGYFREFMFHTLLSEKGYHVIDMDYRASAGYGAAWRTAIYRQMGTPELEDLEDGVAWLVKDHGVDPDRVGVYGGSYGGFMTMMALFKQPELFAAGAALRPVTDWAHYNHPYTSNILNTPEVDPEAYARSSPIEFADGLQDPLLICAPMLDDNVFFQDTVRLAQRFIELGVQGWEVALFPVEPHGFRQPYSWLDEYRRIFELFEDELHPRQ